MFGFYAWNECIWFDLATLLVLDDKREGFPAAFILSNRQDSTALTLAFAAIKEHTCISPRVLMTDDSESFYNAWKIVFGIPEKRLLCTWHVDRSWRRSISRLITKKEIQVEAYKIVRSLLVETDEAAFNIMLKEALKMFDEKEEMKEFKRYFELTYSKRSEVWAYCHRKCLMKFVRDRVFDRLISLEKGKISSKISQLRKRHKVGQHLTSLCIQNNEEWSVSSTRGKDIYIVKRKVTCSKECTLMCRECNHCLHNFTCTCIDNAVQWNMCKHIHFICSQNLNKINSTILEERLSLDSRITDEEMIICENRKVLEKEAHVDNLRATSTRTEISKEEFQKECMQLINKASPEQYDNVLTLLRNTIDSSHLFPEAIQEL
ncbi:uncharacterized protein TNIN_85641 [Trichonephila inaurata madagascariensis]|uniref:MULE transposase domain-containing protein n=1 Tax=Trichonephila inaurata madagascariensis TaxID=2747483 RepID=A0A8X6YVM4_9ARAC|nr:uncharacterized protein TNIN_85641 [Trichonephila inaurata madagascariensis]